MTRFAPQDVVASFDSAAALHAMTVAALRGEDFAQLGRARALGSAVRAAGALPWPLLRRLYTRIGAAEGIPADRLAEVDLGSVAAMFADAYPERAYPAVAIGSSNGAFTHLFAHLQIPWLPGTALLPVGHRQDPRRTDQALLFGARHAGPLLDNNPDISLHQMHDPEQDRLMAGHMAYFRFKWTGLPPPYRRFLERRLAPGAPVLRIDDTSTWPVTTVTERHVFQTGGQGGKTAEDYLHDRRSPRPDTWAPEAEWGSGPGLSSALALWCREHGHPLVSLRFRGPQSASHPVAVVIREHLDGAQPADTLVIPSFVVGDAWRSVTLGLVPFWAFFSARPAVDALTDHLRRIDRPYAEALVFPFQHGASSTGLATIADWTRALAEAGVPVRFPGLDPAKHPHDIGMLGRYGRALHALPAARAPWSPAGTSWAVTRLRREGLDVRRFDP